MFARILVATLVLAGCADIGEEGQSTQQGPAESAAADPATTSTAALSTTDGAVSGLHILIAYKGAMRAPNGTTRSRQDAERLATQLVSQLKSGENFSDLARKYSDDTSSVRGGDTGAFTRDAARKPFDVLFTLKPGELAGLTETGYGFHIIERAP